MYPVLAYFANVIFGLSIDGSNNEPSFNHFSILYCAIIIAILLFPLLNMKEISFLIKISSKGIFLLSFIMLFVLFTGIKSFSNTSFDYETIFNNGHSPSHVSLFGSDPSKLAGAISLGYFTHNIIIPIMKNNENPKNNKRDLFLGYFFAFVTYTSIGIFGYYGFSGSDFSDYYNKSIDIPFAQVIIFLIKNWFSFFDQNNRIMLLFRLLSVLQLCSVLPIIVYVTRIQVIIFK